MPRRATWKDFRWVNSTSSNRMNPEDTGVNPVIRLNSVVLPAPLGPIRPTRSPRWIAPEKSSTATRPPKRRESWLISSSAATSSTPAELPRRLPGRAQLAPREVDRRDFAQDAARQEQDRQEHHHPHH